MEQKNQESNSPEIWEDWEEEWAEDYLQEISLLGEEHHEYHENISSLDGKYYKIFMNNSNDHNR